MVNITTGWQPRLSNSLSRHVFIEKRFGDARLWSVLPHERFAELVDALHTAHLLRAEVIDRGLPHARWWLSVLQKPGQPIDWSFLDAYGSGVDCPVCMFPAELLEAFPDAKFILGVRDPESWCV
jgi:hypothetical protein